MCYRFEESVHRFQNMVIDRMLGVRRVPEGDRGRRSRCFRLLAGSSKNLGLRARSGGMFLARLLGMELRAHQRRAGSAKA